MAKPGSIGKGARFGCGFVFGLMVGGIIFAYSLLDSDGGGVAGIFGLALVCAFLSMRYGEVFWRMMAKWFVWF